MNEDHHQSRMSKPHWRVSRRWAARLIGLASSLAIGCRSSPKPIETAACVGTPYLLVRNAIGRSVDVYYNPNRGATPYLVGTAGNGPTELTLPPNVDANGSFRARDKDGK